MPQFSSTTRTISIASGKGGAGKTSVAACFAWILAERGHTVCLLDVDLGLSNVDVLLGLSPRFTLEDVVLGDTPIDQALVRVRPGLDVMSGGGGAAALADLDQGQRARFLKHIAGLDGYDFLILDNAPGIHRQVVAFCLAAREQIIVLNPEPTSVTDAYALFKVLRQNGLSRPPYILLNRVHQDFNHALLMQRFAAVCKKHLQAAILPLGAIPDDPLFRQAANKSVLPVNANPGSPGAMALLRMAALLAKRTLPRDMYVDIADFWHISLANLFQDMPATPDQGGQNLKTAPQTVPDQPGQDTAQDIIVHLEQAVASLSSLPVTHLRGSTELTRRISQAADVMTRLSRTLREQQ
jgi:MinD-like ATPase involved in chromosome partitioning or flagellar assembly